MFILTIVTMGVWLGMPLGAPAHAITDCDALVIDTTSQKVLGDQLEIESAALRLENLGLDVKIRAFETQPEGGWTTYQQQHVKSCADWQGPGGYTKGNLVTILFSMDRKSYIFYGSNLEAELNDEVDRIRADYMNAEFKNRHFPEGITGTIAEIARVVEAHSNPEPSGPTVVHNESSSGGNAFGWVAAIIAAIVTFIGLLFGGFKLIQLRRRHREELATARLAAETATKNAATAMTNLDGFVDTGRSVELILPLLNEEDRQQLRNLVSRFETLNAEAIQAASDIVDNPSLYSLDKARKIPQYDRIMAVQDNVIRLAEMAGVIMLQLDEECQIKDREITQAPETLQAHRAMVEKLIAQRDQLQGEGYRFNLDGDFNSIRELLDRADRELEAKRHGDALDELRESKQLLDAIQATLTRVPEWHKELQEECVVLTGLLVETEAATNTAISVRREIAEQYTNCDSDLATEGEMQILLTRALASLDLAKVASGMDRQQWNVADQHLADCVRNIRDLKSDGESIADRFTGLASLRETLPTRFDALETEIIETSGAVDDRKGEQKKFERKLATCSESLAQVRRDFEASKPDLLSINTELTSLEAQIKKIEGDSEDVHKKEVRRRSAQSSSSSNGFGTGLGTGYVAGSVFGSSGGSGGGGFDSGGGSSGGSWGGGDGGSSGGDW